MTNNETDALQRYLLPGESVLQSYARVRAAGKFRAFLTDRRILMVRRNATEELHLNAISSMGSRARRHRGVIALGAVFVFLGPLTMVGTEYFGSLLLSVLGVGLVVAGALWKTHFVTVYASGREFRFRGTSGDLDEFIRDVRIQQSKFSNYGGPAATATPYPNFSPPPPPPNL